MSIYINHKRVVLDGLSTKWEDELDQNLVRYDTELIKLFIARDEIIKSKNLKIREWSYYNDGDDNGGYIDGIDGIDGMIFNRVGELMKNIEPKCDNRKEKLHELMIWCAELTYIDKGTKFFFYEDNSTETENIKYLDNLDIHDA